MVSGIEWSPKIDGAQGDRDRDREEPLEPEPELRSDDRLRRDPDELLDDSDRDLFFLSGRSLCRDERVGLGEREPERDLDRDGERDDSLPARSFFRSCRCGTLSGVPPLPAIGSSGLRDLERTLGGSLSLGLPRSFPPSSAAPLVCGASFVDSGSGGSVFPPSSPTPPWFASSVFFARRLRLVSFSCLPFSLLRLRDPDRFRSDRSLLPALPPRPRSLSTRRSVLTVDPRDDDDDDDDDHDDDHDERLL